jgi:Arc/MetJ family transcription regulator
MAVTSVDVDLELLGEVKRVLGVKTNREAIDSALRSVSRRAAQLRALEVLATISVDLEAPKVDYPA